jgi:hypothetical protein
MANTSKREAVRGSDGGLMADTVQICMYSGQCVLIRIILQGEGVSERSADDNIWNQEGESTRRQKKTE